MRTLRVLHVGVANRGTWPLRHCNAATGFAPAALCDVSDAALAEARALTGLSQADCYRDIGDALARADIDCVIACLPTVFHVAVAKRCVAVGVPVLIEKGMAPDWAGARDLAQAIARTPGAVAAVAQNYRYHPVERALWRAANDETYPGYVGRPHLVEYTQWRVRPEVRTLTFPFAGVWDMSCHHFDNLQFWLGPIRSVSAHAWRADWSPYAHPDANTVAFLTVGDAEDVRVHYGHGHDAARNVMDVQFHGARGAVSTDGQTVTFTARPTEQFGARPSVVLPPEPTGGVDDLLRDFHAYVVEGREPGISVRNNLEVMAACELLVRSVKEKRTVRREELDDER